LELLLDDIKGNQILKIIIKSDIKGNPTLYNVRDVHHKRGLKNLYSQSSSLLIQDLIVEFVKICDIDKYCKIDIL